MLILIRGMPGSGKSTLARAIFDRLGRKELTTWHENDMFVDYGRNNDRIPDQREFDMAKARCQQLAFEMLTNSRVRFVIVSNCFLTRASMAAYKEVAANYGHTVLVLTCRGHYGSTKYIPEAVLQSMAAVWQD